MSTKRQGNWLSQMRIDVPHIRAMESSIAADFDYLVGVAMSGRKSYVLSGLTIPISGISQAADALTLVVANAVISHWNGSEAGTILVIDADVPNEALKSTNSKVQGSFIASSVNYVGLDFKRITDPTSSDLVQFLDPDTNLENPKIVPLARVLDYKIIISTQPFSVSSNVLPIAKVQTNGSNAVVRIDDARNLMFRLGIGGDVPDTVASYTWADRSENPIFATGAGDPDPFTSVDKDIGSMKEWMDAVMSRLWETGGGQHWFTPNSRDDIKVAYGTPVLVANGENWFFDGAAISWSGVRVLFGNSTATFNIVANNAAGTAIANGQCVYVDVDRSTDGATVSAAIGNLATLGQSTIPGQRVILAWRISNTVYFRDHHSEAALNFPQSKLVYFKGTPLLNVNGTYNGVTWQMPLAGAGNQLVFQLPIPFGSSFTKLYLYGRFTTAAAGVARIRVDTHGALTTAVLIDSTFQPAAAPQTFEATTLGQIVGTIAAGPTPGQVNLVPVASAQMVSPNSSSAAAVYSVTVTIFVQAAGAGVLELYGFGLEYLFPAVTGI